jgi:hypothetical protein
MRGEKGQIKELQNLINSGQAWRMEGSVGRACMRAIEDGECVLGTKGHKDYYGSYVPSRFEVKSGTKGSIAYRQAIRKGRGAWSKRRRK